MKNQNVFFTVKIFLFLILTVFIISASAFPADVTLQWDPNTEPDLAGYKIYYDTDSGVPYTGTGANQGGSPIVVAIENLTDPDHPQYTITGLTGSGTYHFAVTAYDQETPSLESGYSVEVTFSTYVITSSAGPNGTVSPSGTVTVNSGETQTVTITPDAGYHIADVLVDGSSIGAVSSYTFTNIAANHTLSATFAVNTYTITASAGSNGAISPSGYVTAAYGTSRTFTVTPNMGYHIANVLVNGSSVGAVSSYTFNSITADHSIIAIFTINSYAITASAGSNGTVSPSGTVTVNYGGSQTFTVTPNTGYHIANVLVDGSSVGAVSSYTFNNITASHTLSATFALNTYTINASAEPNGTVSPSGTVTVNYGGSQTFTVTPNTGYHITNVLVDGSPVGAVSSYTFTNITTNHTLSATFGTENQPPFASAGPDQLVNEQSIVTLSGSNSTDPDDGIASFSWTQIQGTQVVLSNPNDEETTFTAPDVSSSGETLVFQLTVQDYSGEQATDTCIVNVSFVNMPPVAAAGPNQTVNEGDMVVLDASGSTDPDDGIASFQWTQIEGVPVVLSDSRAIQPTFIAPNAGPEGISLRFSLIVTDQGGLQSSDTCIVNVFFINMPPGADAGPDQVANERETVLLDGSGSFDEDDGIVSYQWVQTFGTPVILSDPASDQPIFQAPNTGVDGETLRFQLTVIDNSGLQDQDNCIINVRPIDYCPDDPDKIDPGECGCGISDEDTDNDGTSDCIDNCPFDPNKTEPGINGCGETEPLPVTDNPISEPEEDQEPPTPDNNTNNDISQDDNQADQNNDGIPDRDQANFTSLQLDNAQDYVTIESPPGTILNVREPSMIAAEMLSDTESIRFPSGLFEFTVSNIQSGGSVAVILTLPKGSVVDTYYKYGKTPENPVDHWYEFLYDGETGAEINGNMITLHFVDGQRGDDDLDGSNGTIVDPGGPALIEAINQAAETSGDGGGGGGCFIGSFMG